jgi:hypothetical protein
MVETRLVHSSCLHEQQRDDDAQQRLWLHPSRPRPRPPRTA